MSYPGKYSIKQINTIPTITGGVQIVSTLLFAWTSDGFLRGRRWPAVYIGGVGDPNCFELAMTDERSL